MADKSLLASIPPILAAILLRLQDYRFYSDYRLLLQADAPHIKEENTILQNTFNSYNIIQVKNNAKGNKQWEIFKSQVSKDKRNSRWPKSRINFKGTMRGKRIDLFQRCTNKCVMEQHPF